MAWPGLAWPNRPSLCFAYQHTNMSISSRPSCPTSNPAAYLQTGKAVRWLKSLGPSTQVGDPEKVPSSWLWISPALVVTAV